MQRAQNKASSVESASLLNEIDLNKDTQMELYYNYAVSQVNIPDVKRIYCNPEYLKMKFHSAPDPGNIQTIDMDCDAF